MLDNDRQPNSRQRLCQCHNAWNDELHTSLILKLLPLHPSNGLVHPSLCVGAHVSICKLRCKRSLRHYLRGLLSLFMLHKRAATKVYTKLPLKHGQGRRRLSSLFKSMFEPDNVSKIGTISGAFFVTFYLCPISSVSTTLFFCFNLLPPLLLDVAGTCGRPRLFKDVYTIPPFLYLIPTVVVVGLAIIVFWINDLAPRDCCFSSMANPVRQDGCINTTGGQDYAPTGAVGLSSFVGGSSVIAIRILPSLTSFSLYSLVSSIGSLPSWSLCIV